MAKTAKKKLKKLKQPTTLRGQSDEEVLFLRQRLQDAEEKLSTAMFEPASRFDDRGVSRRRRSLEIWRARVAATMRPQRGSIRGDESRRRRGHDADIPKTGLDRDVRSSRPRSARPPRLRRGHSAETRRGGAAAATSARVGIGAAKTAFD